MNALAAILSEVNKPLELREIEWQPLQYGQVLCEILTTGICGAQIAEIRGEKNPEAPMPRLMGHEAAIRVLEIGPGVTTVRKTDLCSAHWRKGDGIESENPKWSIQSSMIPPVRVEHTAGRITTFATHSVISENRLTRVVNDTPVELCALLGCATSTALGTIEHEAKLLMGESVLIIGCGGLGLNLILAAKLRGASRIVATDWADKKETAKSMGATEAWCGTHLTEKPDAGSFDVVIDTTGNKDAISDGIALLSPSGRFIMVGQPKPRENITLTNARHLFDGTGKSIIATQGGRFQPSTDIKRYVDAFRAGRFSIEGIVSHRFSLSEINSALDLVRNGQVGRVLIQCNEQ